jgi:nucleoid-associated protein YejK
MAIKIRNAILHVLRNDMPSVFSQHELDYTSEICEAFIGKHVKKLINNPAVRTANFAADSDVYALICDYQNGVKYFKETSLALAEKMDELMQEYKSLPPCDILVTRIGHKNGEFLAVLLLNFHEVYAHKSSNSDNQLKTFYALPFNSGKVECAALIELAGAALPIGIMEKPAIINGNSVNFFSEIFLNCETSPSEKEQATLINEVTAEFVEEFYNNDPKISAKIKTAVIEEAVAEEGLVSMDNVANRAFSAPEEKSQYISTLRDAGIREDLPLCERVVKSQFTTHKIKAENGVEIRFPAELAAIEQDLEITTHSDGTVSVFLKNLRLV